MTPDMLRWPVILTGGVVIHYGPSEDFEPTYAGGPLEQMFQGATFGPEPLHRILTLSVSGLPQPSGVKLRGKLPFFYGMRFSGCEMRYRLEVEQGIERHRITARQES